MEKVWECGLMCSREKAFRINQINLALRPPKHFNEEEAERRSPSDNRTYGEFALIQEVQLVPPQMLRTELVRTLAKVTGKIFDRKQVQSNRFGRIVSTLEFFQHPLS